MVYVEKNVQKGKRENYRLYDGASKGHDIRDHRWYNVGIRVGTE